MTTQRTAEREDLSVWPASACAGSDGDLLLGGVGLVGLAARFGTPLYVLDEAEVRARCEAYLAAFPGADVVYAAKALLCRAVATWVYESGLGLDVCSAGELEIACAADVPASRLILHGNAKTAEDLRTAVRRGLGRIVIDNFGDIAQLAAGVPPDRCQQVLVRVVPGISAGGHPKIRTGTDTQQFGLSMRDGSAQYAISRVLQQPRLQLVGLHCHLGSQITSVKPYLQAVFRMVGMMARVRDTGGVELAQLNLGGGYGIAYRPGDSAMDLQGLAERVARELRSSCAAAGLPVPRLTLEPGRGVIGPAGVALYRVVSVKRVGQLLFVAVDGGMSDNPRPALYGAPYDVRLIGRRSVMPNVPTVVVGRHCEAGDVISDGAQLPIDVRPGDLLAVPAAGAYHLSMASTYNACGRPPLVAVHGGSSRVLVRRETVADLCNPEVAV